MDMSIDRSTCLCIHGPVYLQHGQIYLQPSTYSLQKFQSIGRWTDLWIDLWHRPVYAVGRQVAIDLSTYSLYVQPTACLKIRALMSVQTGLAPPNTGGAKPVCLDIRTTPYTAMLRCVLCARCVCCTRICPDVCIVCLHLTQAE